MSVEVTYLAYAGLLAVAQLILMAIPVNLQLGTGYTGGPRDTERSPTGMAGRLHRAFGNHMEGLILFTAAVAVVELASANTPGTALAAQIYFWARVAYVPAYASGFPYLRSAIWAVGFFALPYMLLTALL